jgi:hypothetical protein
LGKGFPIVSFIKQKINTRARPNLSLWASTTSCWQFAGRGIFYSRIGVDDNIVYQDNKSEILLEQNGKASSSKRTKHIAIRYFFVTDRVAKGDLTIAWCPTTAMIGDNMTKPLQGASFRKFRDYIMGVRSPTDCLVRQDGRHRRSVLGRNGNG